MLRQNRGFTVEIKGRRKSGAFDWKSAFAAAEIPLGLSPVLPEMTVSPSDDETLPHASAPRRVLPALSKDELVSKPPLVETTAATRPALPGETAPVQVPALTPGAKRVAKTEPPSDRLVSNEARSDRPEVSVPSPIDPIHRTRRIAAALSRAEKWKRRLPSRLR
ncbi:MAG: hypothetical protein ABW003_18850 [Microvirga sp.]